MRDEVIREVEQFLYREARLLDERRFHDWLELFTDDARYWMVGRSNRYPKSSKAIAILDPDRYVEDDMTSEDGLAILLAHHDEALLLRVSTLFHMLLLDATLLGTVVRVQAVAESAPGRQVGRATPRHGSAEPVLSRRSPEA